MTAWTLGFMAPVGKTDIARLMVVQRDVETDGKNATGVMIGYDHFLKPNWAIYGRVAMIANKMKSSSSYAGIPVEESGDDPRNLAVGMYYHF
jgi:hypothetical protein